MDNLFGGDQIGVSGFPTFRYGRFKPTNMNNTILDNDSNSKKVECPQPQPQPQQSVADEQPTSDYQLPTIMKGAKIEISEEVLNWILIIAIIIMFVVIVLQQISIQNQKSLIKMLEVMKK